MTQVANPIEFTPERLALVKDMIARYPEGKQKSALLPVLHVAQDQWGWLSSEVMDHVAALLSIEPIEVYEVATFYTMFHLQPVGKNVIEYCHTSPCCLMGAESVYDHLQQKLGIKTGETTPDGLFSLKEEECLAACGWGPVFQIREKYYMNLTNEKVDSIIEELSQ